MIRPASELRALLELEIQSVTTHDLRDYVRWEVSRPSWGVTAMMESYIKSQLREVFT